ncbi:unnamed protein product [Amoebophrya sp. A120]|nr:unnamed protein product [Amoebophrya sp. A120]|eukprot:GSA120T00006804001.1
MRSQRGGGPRHEHHGQRRRRTSAPNHPPALSASRCECAPPGAQPRPACCASRLVWRWFSPGRGRASVCSAGPGAEPFTFSGRPAPPRGRSIGGQPGSRLFVGFGCVFPYHRPRPAGPHLRVCRVHTYPPGPRGCGACEGASPRRRSGAAVERADGHTASGVRCAPPIYSRVCVVPAPGLQHPLVSGDGIRACRPKRDLRARYADCIGANAPNASRALSCSQAYMFDSELETRRVRYRNERDERSGFGTGVAGHWNATTPHCGERYIRSCIRSVNSPQHAPLCQLHSLARRRRSNLRRGSDLNCKDSRDLICQGSEKPRERKIFAGNMVDSLKVIAIDLDTVLLKGLEDYVMSVRKMFRGKKMPALWVWIPDFFKGFYENSQLNQAKCIDYFLVGPFQTGDYLPNQVLLFSRSVKTLLPIREKKLCQTIVGDSLQVLESANATFTGEYKFELTTSQKEYLQYRRKSKIYQYLQFSGSLDDLNKGLWIQEKCEGVVITGGNLIATSKTAIEEWESIIRKELEYIPDKDGTDGPPEPKSERRSSGRTSGSSSSKHKDTSDTARGDGTTGRKSRSSETTSAAGGGVKSRIEGLARESTGSTAASMHAHQPRVISMEQPPNSNPASRSISTEEQNKSGDGAAAVAPPQMNKSKSQEELEMALLISMQEKEAAEKREADELAAAVNASVQLQHHGGNPSIELVD